MESFDSTKKSLSGDAPSKYLDRLKKHAGVSDTEFNAILQSHAVNPEFLYNDDFYRFFDNRKELIIQKIEKAMGKTIHREQIIEKEGKFIGGLFEDDEINQ